MIVRIIFKSGATILLNLTNDDYRRLEHWSWAGGILGLEDHPGLFLRHDSIDGVFVEDGTADDDEYAPGVASTD